MAFLETDQIKEIAKCALKEVADFSGDIDSFEFKQFQEYHKTVFLTKLKELINKLPYYGVDSKVNPEKYYDVPLSKDTLNTWASVKDCINYVYENQTVKKRDPNKVQFL
ncbi:hypothetical protein [Parabacteroides sp. FAFU027]|uniref:hypothetical protein n=1 Tax=Parabacteroides sp. FAFU027 TaxID=2922715 RepID=UPI001FAEBC57|nr:hypothetical protein [Parabacteroides sp. FAFU027]